MNAVILAAGLGIRLLPYTEIVPKPLININGITVVERQIIFLKSIGIQEINVIVGYMAEKFKFLESKYSVRLIFNSKYKQFNNIYSLFLSRNYLKNTWILDGDVFIVEDFLSSPPCQSTCFSIFKSNLENEWILESSKNGKLIRILTPNEFLDNPTYKNGAYVMSGISFWDEKATDLIKRYLEQCIFDKLRKGKNVSQQMYWEQIIKDNLHGFDIFVNKIDFKCVEIDNPHDLAILKINMNGFKKINEPK